MFSEIIDKIRYKLFLNHVKPEIIAYRDSKKRIIKNSRVSNMTHLSNKENINIGENVFIGHFNYMDGYEKLVIEEGCQITNYTSVLTHSSHHAIRLLGSSYNYAAKETIKNVVKSGPVHIGAYSYIGAHSIIMPGSIIGKGCIVSAYSFVNGEFPDYSIIRGQPAKIIGSTKDIDIEFLDKHPEIRNFYYDK